MKPRRNEETYDAFISYAQQADKKLAKAIRGSLQSLAKPFWRARSMRVFLDTESLATGSLSASISNALSSSRFLVVLASPAAKSSKWVGDEIAAFKRLPDRRTNILIVLTEGTLDWDDHKQDFSADSTACPDELRGVFDEEPLFVDLRWVPESGVNRRDRTLFRQSVASLAAEIHDSDKDTLIGSHLTQQRRNLSLATGAAIGLAVLAVAAALSAREARIQARAEQAQRVAALAVAETPDRLERALLLGHAGIEIAETEGAARGLFSVLSQTAGVSSIASTETRPRAIAAVPNSNRLVTGSQEGTVTIWGEGLVAEHELSTLDAGAVRDIVVSPDGRFAYAASDQGMITKVDLETGLVAEETSLRGSARALELSQDGSTLYAAGETHGVVSILDGLSLEPIREVDLPFLRIDSLALNASESFLAVSGRGNVPQTAAPLVVVQLSNDEIVAKAKDPFDSWPAETSCRDNCLHSVSSVAADPHNDELFWFGTFGGVVAEWRFLTELPEPIGLHSDQVSRVRVFDDGVTLASTGFDHDVRFWDTRTNRQVGPTRTHHGGPVWDVALISSDLAVTVGEDMTITTLAVSDWSTVLSEVVLEAPPGSEIQGLMPLNDAELAVAVGDQLYIANLDDPENTARAGPYVGGVWALAHDAADDILYFGLSSGEVVRWDRPGGTSTIEKLPLSPAALALHPDNETLAVAGTDPETNEHVTFFLEAQTLAVLSDQITGGIEAPNSVGFTADGRFVIVAGHPVSSSFHAWPSLDVITFERDAASLTKTFSASSELFAVGTSGQDVEVYSNDAELIAVFTGHRDIVASSAIDPSGRVVASGGGDAEVRLWDLGDRLAAFGPALVGHSSDVEYLAFSPDGRYLYSASRSEVMRWNLDRQSWPQAACDIVERSFTQDEWTKLTGLETDVPDGCE